jgi:ABC-type branched-subunit amino acid transport system ATPase component
MDDYVLRRELDLRTNFPEVILELKTSRQFQNMDLAKKIELYDNFYVIVKESFLSEYILKEEKNEIGNAAMEQILERARQEWE